MIREEDMDVGAAKDARDGNRTNHKAIVHIKSTKFYKLSKIEL